MDSRSGIKFYSDTKKSQIPFWASLLDDNSLNNLFLNTSQEEEYTRLEKMLILSIADSLSKTSINIKDPKTLIILSSAKGNIDLLEDNWTDILVKKRILFSETARIIQKFFGNPNEPLVISNGCISGVLALITATRLIQSGQYENIVIAGGDIISEFTISGFQSFKALADEVCRPFDQSRTGLNLGEGAATILLTTNIENAGKHKIEIAGGAVSNDANHISGPSRTGEGLYISIKNALKEAEQKGLPKIGYISAHGTATIYNDEMESLAFTSAGLEEVPTNSLKGFFGHTLGAAGLIESVITIRSMANNQLIASLGYEKHGVTGNQNIIKKTEKKFLDACLKTGSGFGGCNAAIIYKKNE